MCLDVIAREYGGEVDEIKWWIRKQYSKTNICRN